MEVKTFLNAIMMAFLAIAIMTWGVPTSAQVSAPDAKAWATHVPANWKLLEVAKNGADAVLLVEQNDPSKRIANDGLGTPTLNLNPRSLIFLSGAGGRYEKTGQADKFAPSEGSEDSPCLQDPLLEGGIGFEKRILTVKLHYWMSCGSYSVAIRTFKFRKENSRYRLIGLDILSFSRASGEGEETSINYLSGKMRVKTGVQVIGLEDGAPTPKSQTRWSNVGRDKYYLDSMDQGACIDPDSAPGWCGY